MKKIIFLLSFILISYFSIGQNAKHEEKDKISHNNTYKKIHKNSSIEWEGSFIEQEKKHEEREGKISHKHTSEKKMSINPPIGGEGSGLISKPKPKPKPAK